MILARRMTDFLLATRRALHLVYLPLVAFGLASSVLAIPQSLGWPLLPVWNPDYPAGLLYNATVQGAFLALCVVTCYTYGFYWLIPGLAPGLFIADSRGGFAAIAFGLIAHHFRHPLWLLVLVLSFGAALSINPSHSDMQRMAIWYAAATHLTLWGHGWGSFWNLWIGNPAWWPQYAHNDYLQAVFELGLFAAIPFALLGWAVSRTFAVDWPILATFLFIACFSMPLHMPLVAAFGAVALALTLGAQDA